MNKKILTLFVLSCLSLATFGQVKSDRDQANESSPESTTNSNIQKINEEGTLLTIRFDNEVKPQFSEAKSTLKQKLNVNENCTFNLIKTQTDEIGMTHDKYQLFYQNIPVEFAHFIVHIKNGLIESMNGEYYEISNLNPTPSISSENAVALAKQKINATRYLTGIGENGLDMGYEGPKPELVVFPAVPKINTKARLAYKMDIYASEPLYRAYVYVDAETGEVFFENNRIHETNVAATGTSLHDGTVSFTADFTGSNYRLRQTSSGNGIRTYNYNNVGPATDVTSATTSFSNTKGVQAHWGAEKTHAYYLQKHNRNSYDNAGAILNSYFSYDFNYVNAFWNGTAMYYGDGNGTTIGPLISADVTGHEITHAVTEYSANLVYQNESGALNESFSDIFGEAIEKFAKGSNNWLMGSELFISGSSAFRSMANPKLYNDPDCYTGTYWYNQVGCIPTGGSGGNDYCGVHTNSGVQNKWFYLLTVGGSGTNDLANAYAVTGIGMDDAAAIAYRSLTVYLTSNSNYAAARANSIQAATDLFGACSMQVEQTTRAWYAVGVGANYSAAVAPTIFISSPSTFLCPGASITLTASGASSYVWSPGGSTANPATFTPGSTTTYTVVGTDAGGCTGSATRVVELNTVPTFGSLAHASICDGSSVTLASSASGSISNSLSTTLIGGNNFSANAFDIHANNTIKIKGFKANITGATQAEIWYKTTSYGNANVTSNAGWVKLGNTVNVVSAGVGLLTNIPITQSLIIPAGSTYGIIVTTNGTNFYTNGTTVGATYSSNADLYITEGHGGSAFGGIFNLTNSPRVFNGQVDYEITGALSSFAWSPIVGLSNPAISNPVASPANTTLYNVTASDANSCTSSGSLIVTVNPTPTVSGVASANPVCSGSPTTLTGSGTATCDVGFTSQFSGNPGFGANYILGTKMTVSSGGTLTGLSLIGRNTGANVQMAIYSDLSGVPNNLIATSVAGIVGGSSTTLAVSPGVSIPAGDYWIMAIYSGGANNNHTYFDQGGASTIIYYTGITFGNSLPTNASGFSSYTGNNFNYYMNIECPNYTWSGGVTNGVAFTPTTSGITTYTVTGTNGNGCSATSSLALTVNPVPNIIAYASPSSICVGGSSYLTMEPVAPTYYFEEDFVNNSKGWTLGTEWGIGSATASSLPSYGNPDPGFDHTASGDNGVAGVNIGGNAIIPTIHPAYYLTSPVVNLTSASGSVYLNFWRWLNSDYTPYMQNFVDVYNGTAWVNIWSSGASPGVQDNAWNLKSYDVTAHKNANFQFRIGFSIGSTGVFSVSSWNLDDVSLTSAPLEGAITAAWTGPVAIASPASLSTFVTPTASGTQTYVVTATDANSCSTSASLDVIVNALPDPMATATPSTICQGSTSVLSSTAMMTSATLFKESFADNSQGWTLGTEWGIGSATTSSGQVGSTFPDPSKDHTPGGNNGIAGVVIGGNASTTVHSTPYYITSPVIDISSLTTAKVNFWRWLNSDYTPFMQNYIDVFDGTAWVNIWSTLGPPVTAENSWNFKSYDVTPYINANFQVRFGHAVLQGGAYTVSSWNIDDLSITGTFPSIPTWTGPATIANPNMASTNVTPTTTGALNYTVSTTDTNGCVGTSSVTLTVNTAPCDATLNANFFIQGYYLGMSFMQPVLMNQGVSGALATEVDDVTVDLMDASSPYNLAYTFTGKLQTNGSIVCTYPIGAIGNSYYIRLTHRNSVETWSATPLTIATTNTYSFSSAATQAYGGNQLDAAMDGVYSIYNGDVTQDGTVDIFDFLTWDADNQAFASGYFATDFNGDGNVDIFDFLIWDPNNQNFVGLITP